MPRNVLNPCCKNKSYDISQAAQGRLNLQIKTEVYSTVCIDTLFPLSYRVNFYQSVQAHFQQSLSSNTFHKKEYIRNLRLSLGKKQETFKKHKQTEIQKQTLKNCFYKKL